MTEEKHEDVQAPIFCRYESLEFPANEFSIDPEWGRVHEVTPRHSFMGEVIDEEWVLHQLGGM